MTEKVAILPWGDTIEDYLDTIGVSLAGFATEMSGGWLFGYAEALRSAGMEVCLICISRDAARPQRLRNPKTGLETIALPLPGWLRGLRAIAGHRRKPQRDSTRPLASWTDAYTTPVGGLAATLRAEGCTHVLCQEYEYHRFLPAQIAARRAGARAFATFQGGTPADKRIARASRRLAIQRADGLIIGSGVEVARVVETYGLGSERTAVIPNPLDLTVWRPVDRAGARRTLDLPDDAFVAICHARIDYWPKGIDVLLEAWRRLHRRHPDRDLRLHLIGSGPDDSLLEAEIARDPVPGLRWPRRYIGDRDEMRRELSAADAYVLASRHEGFPVAPLEAMACGLPLVLSDFPGAADILPEGARSGGTVVPKKDPEAIADAVSHLVLDPRSRARQSTDARRRVESFASVPAVGRRLADFLRANAG